MKYAPPSLFHLNLTRERKASIASLGLFLSTLFILFVAGMAYNASGRFVSGMLEGRYDLPQCFAFGIIAALFIGAVAVLCILWQWVNVRYCKGVLWR